MSSSTDHLVALWFEYFRLQDGERTERKALELGEPADVVAAVDEVREATRRGGTTAVALVLALLRAATSEGERDLVAAAALWDLLVSCQATSDRPEDLATLRHVVDVARQEPPLARGLTRTGLPLGAVSREAQALLRPWLQR